MKKQTDQKLTGCFKRLGPSGPTSAQAVRFTAGSGRRFKRPQLFGCTGDL